MAISSPYPAQRGFFHVSESDTLLLLAQRMPAAALSRKNFTKKLTMLIPSHHLKEGAVYTAGTCCANIFSLLYSSTR